MEKTIRALTIAFYSVFTIIIGYIFFASLANSLSLLTLIILLLFIPGIYLIHRFLLKYENFLNEHYRLLLALLLLLCCAFKLYLAFFFALPRRLIWTQYMVAQ